MMRAIEKPQISLHLKRKEGVKRDIERISSGCDPVTGEDAVTELCLRAGYSQTVLGPNSLVLQGGA